MGGEFTAIIGVELLFDVRLIATWLGISAICLAILVVPFWTGAKKVAYEMPVPDVFFELNHAAGANKQRSEDRECAAALHTRRAARDCPKR